MADQTYYTILGVSETATHQEIRAAYRDLLKKIHPDTVATLSPNLRREAVEVSQEIIEAYSVLSRANSRAQYDPQLTGHRQQSPSAPTAPSNSSYRPPQPSPPCQRQVGDTFRSKKQGYEGTSPTFGAPAAALVASISLGIYVPLFLLSPIGAMYGAAGFVAGEVMFMALLAWGGFAAYRSITYPTGTRGWLIGISISLVLNAFYTLVVISNGTDEVGTKVGRDGWRKQAPALVNLQPEFQLEGTLHFHPQTKKPSPQSIGERESQRLQSKSCPSRRHPPQLAPDCGTR
jgi:hypothetical protein